MQRRSFLGALMAAAGALAGGKAVASAAVAPAPPPDKALTPGVAVTDDTAKFERSLDDAQRQVMEMLKDCRAVRVEQNSRVDFRGSWTITYRHAPHAQYTSLDAESARVSAICVPKSVSLMQISDPLDVTMLGSFGYSKTYSLDEQDFEIEVEWI